MTQELEVTPGLCLSGAGTPHFPQPWGSRVISTSFHYCLSFSTLRDHVWKTVTLMAHTGVTQLVRAGSRAGRWDQKPLKEQEIQGWFHRWFLTQNGWRAFPRRKTGLGVQKTIRYICFLVCTRTLLSITEVRWENWVQILIVIIQAIALHFKLPGVFIAAGRTCFAEQVDLCAGADKSIDHCSLHWNTPVGCSVEGFWW